MPYDFNEHKEFIKSVIEPAAKEIEKTMSYPRELIKRLGGKNYLLPTMPSKYGGIELTPLEYGSFTEETGKICQATRALLTVHNSLVAESILRWGTEQQKEYYLPFMASGQMIGAFALSEPKTGSDAGGVITGYVKKEDGYYLSGEKKWISFGGIADFFIVIAACGKKTTAFLVNRNTSGVKVEEMRGLLAARGAHVAHIVFENTPVSSDDILGGEGNGLCFVVQTALDHGRFSIAWGGIGIAGAALEAMVTYARLREQFGQKIYRHEAVQQIIGECTAKYHAAKALCEKAALLRAQRNNDSVMTTNMAKYISSKAAVEISGSALQVLGGNGCWDEYPAEKLFREARILEIIEGTSQIQEKLIATYALRKYFVKDLYSGKNI